MDVVLISLNIFDQRILNEKIINILKENSCKKVLFAGKVHKPPQKDKT